MIEILEHKKKWVYIITVILILVIMLFLWKEAGQVGMLGKSIAIILLMIPISLEIIFLLECVREWVFGTSIKIKDIEVKIDNIKYNKRIIEIDQLTKDEIQLSIEEAEYLLNTWYKYEKYDKNFFVGVITISGISVFINNIITSAEKFKKIFEGLNQNIIEFMIIIIILIFIVLLFGKNIKWFKEEKANNINRTLNKIVCDLKYYKKLSYEKNEYEYYL